MIILVEGNEGTGKTTLINRIMQEIPAVYVKYPKEVRNTYELYSALAGLKKTVILDRGFISDLAYRMWDTNEGQMTLKEIGDITNWRNSLKIIWCWNENGFEDAKRRGEDYIVDYEAYELIDTNLRKIKRLLNSFTDLDMLDYNYRYTDIDDVINFIKKGE